MQTSVLVVVPCYNEAQRLDAEQFLALASSDPHLGLMFIDDGSNDGTLGVLERLTARLPERLCVLRLTPNRGKAEAVRAGLREACARGAEFVGYVDADFSTPGAEVLRLLDLMRERPADVLIGSRVQLLGAEIHRSARRHYLGRIFATVASLCLPVPVYDTQCGAKFFRNGKELAHVLQVPFSSRWAFDVELLQRLFVAYGGVSGSVRVNFREEPLRAWTDVGGSKLGLLAMAQAGVQLLGLLRRVRASRDRTDGTEATKPR